MSGWIKLHRSLASWEWWESQSTTRLFLTILLHTNYQETKWRGRTIKKGQLLTGRKKLAEWSGLSERQVRTSLANLQSTSELSIEVTNKFSIITVNNWSKYQIEENGDQQNVQQDIKTCPTGDQLTTTSKKEKNINKKEERSVAGETHTKNITDYVKKTKALPCTPDVLCQLYFDVTRRKTLPNFGGDILREYIATCEFAPFDTMQGWRDVFAEFEKSTWLKNSRLGIAWIVLYVNAFKILNGEYADKCSNSGPDYSGV